MENNYGYKNCVWSQAAIDKLENAEAEVYVETEFWKWEKREPIKQGQEIIYYIGDYNSLYVVALPKAPNAIISFDALGDRGIVGRLL